MSSERIVVEQLYYLFQLDARRVSRRKAKASSKSRLVHWHSEWHGLQRVSIGQIFYQSGRFLGGFQHTIGEFSYTDTNDGDPQYFTGREWIELKGEMVYQLVYHGGLVKG